jgi:hypothetical protein
MPIARRSERTVLPIISGKCITQNYINSEPNNAYIGKSQLKNVKKMPRIIVRLTIPNVLAGNHIPLESKRSSAMSLHRYNKEEQKQVLKYEHLINRRIHSP